MGSYKEIEGNLITLALQGMFDVISHGCNCMCRMKSGIAPQMAKAFGCDLFPMELDILGKGDSNKLGQIDAVKIYLLDGSPIKYPATNYKKEELNKLPFIYVINSYTQYKPDKNAKPLDYEALTLCMRKINHKFNGLKVGLPMIGSGLAGGDWGRIKTIIQTELKDCDVTIVIYKP